MYVYSDYKKKEIYSYEVKQVNLTTKYYRQF